MGNKRIRFKIFPDWGKLQIDDMPLTATSKTHLDFSEIDNDLTFEILPVDLRDNYHAQAANLVKVMNGANVLIAWHIFDIKGGTGKNTYKFMNGGLLAGQLDNSIEENILDYSNYNRMATVNLTNADVVIPNQRKDITIEGYQLKAIQLVNSIS